MIQFFVRQYYFTVYLLLFLKDLLKMENQLTEFTRTKSLFGHEKFEKIQNGDEADEWFFAGRERDVSGRCRDSADAGRESGSVSDGKPVENRSAWAVKSVDRELDELKSERISVLADKNCMILSWHPHKSVTYFTQLNYFVEHKEVQNSDLFCTFF